MHRIKAKRITKPSEIDPTTDDPLVKWAIDCVIDAHTENTLTVRPPSRRHKGIADLSKEGILEPKQATGFIISNPSNTIASAITDEGIYDLSQNLLLTDEDLELPEDWEENFSSHAETDTDHES